jgi:hypothetical protein
LLTVITIDLKKLIEAVTARLQISRRVLTSPGDILEMGIVT